jgi:hypothetical protein
MAALGRCILRLGLRIGGVWSWGFVFFFSFPFFSSLLLDE